jgi:RimJ/RimL family protein N-acetyltransferase
MAELATERVYLRPLSAQDATQTYADWMNDPQVNQYLETRHSPQSVESCRAFIEQCNADPASHLFGIFLQQGHRHVGNVKLGFVNSYYQRGQVSLFIGDKTCWGQGLSSEVVRLITAYGFDSLGLHRLEAGCYEDNLASLRIFLKAGYTVEGFMREHVTLNGRRMGCFWLGKLHNEHA